MTLCIKHVRTCSVHIVYNVIFCPLFCTKTILPCINVILNNCSLLASLGNIDFNAEQFPLSITIPSAEKRVIFNISLGQDNEQGSRKVFQLSLSISKPLKGVFIENNKEEANIVINAYNGE